MKKIYAYILLLLDTRIRELKNRILSLRNDGADEDIIDRHEDELVLANKANVFWGNFNSEE